MTLAQDLGFGREDRLVIVNGDDYGMCHSANVAVQQLLTEKAISSATVMMPCGWAKEAVAWAAQHPECDVGVHLTLTSEWEGYRWGPVAHDADVSSLVTREGYFPADCLQVEKQADALQVRHELFRQVEMAIGMGLDPTHLDNHMGSVYGLATGRHFLDVVFELCARFGLPFRLPRYSDNAVVQTPDAEEKARQLGALADAAGVVILDYLLGLPFTLGEDETYAVFRDRMAALLRGLKPGVSEIVIHPMRVSEELKAINPQQWQKRGMEFDVFRDPYIRDVMRQEGIHMIRWSDLRKVQRRGGA